MKAFFLFFLLMPFLALTKSQQPAQWVNPFIGTGGHGHTYPGAARPFGMVQLSPDTRLEGWDGCSGYHYSDSVIYGFSHTHLSGTGISDYNDLLITPFIQNPGAPKTYDLAASFQKKNEIAKAGYYSVVFNNGISAELTATTRAGFHRYTFPTGTSANLSFDLQHRDQLIDVSYTMVSPTEIRGHRVSKAWANEQHFYFTIQFNQPYELIYENASSVFPKSGPSIKKNTSFRLKFKNNHVLVKVGASFTSIDGAVANLNTEINHWNFDEVKNQAFQEWNRELSKILIKTKKNQLDQKVIFYTSLYHSFLNPNTYSDVDGKYRGIDGKIHQTENGHTEYSVFSLWDTFRSTHPLLNLIQPERSEDFIKTFLNHYQQSGRLPVWELAGNETECMIGYHAAPVILDALRQGIPMNQSLALEAMVASGNANVFGLPSYRTYGFVRSEDESEDVSRTLEYAFDDWCTAEMASILHDSRENEFRRRSFSWSNVFDPKDGFFKGRINGEFDHLFDPFEVNFHYTEANAWQYSMFVPQHWSEYTALMGGKEKVLEHLHQLFTTNSETKGREQADITGLIGQYAHGNEPSHHMAFFYHTLGAYATGSKQVHQILNTQYRNEADGLSGNEDCGQMSSWFNLASMGMYPFCPGKGQFVLSLPLFDEIEIQLPNNKKLTITNQTQGSFDYNTYLNGSEVNPSGLDYALLRKGGTLSFKPTKQNGKDNNDALKQISYPIVPIIHAPSMTFTQSMNFNIESIQTLPIQTSYDGIHWKNMISPQFATSKPITIFARTYLIQNTDTIYSPAATATFYQRDANRTIKLEYEFNRMYSGGGNEALIDGIRGGNAFNAGGWQGTMSDLNAVIDLGKITDIHELGLSCLQAVGAWIVLPTSVSYSFSKDGIHFTNPVSNTFANDLRNETNMKRVLETKVNQKEIRFVRISAKNYGKLPDWHLGAGGQAWIFADELIIK